MRIELSGRRRALRLPRRLPAPLLVALALVSAPLLPACASDPSRGIRVVDAVVAGREYDPPGSGGASYRGTGNYYLVFETREGDVSAHYRFQVTQQQYQRYPEGSRVRITIADDLLREIRPAPER